MKLLGIDHSQCENDIIYERWWHRRTLRFYVSILIYGNDSDFSHLEA